MKAALPLLAMCICAYSTTIANDDALKSQLDTPMDAMPTEKSESEYRILFIGDSITRHGTNANVREKLGWGHIAGMAASTEANDFAHVLANKIAEARDTEVGIYFHTAGGGGSVKQRLDAFEAVEDVDPNLVVIQLGEHEKRENGTAQLSKDFAALIDKAQAFPGTPQVICVGPWSPTNDFGARSMYNGWAGEVEATMKSVCEAKGVVYVSIRKAAENPANSGWGESGGVRWHPNDAGHAAYADALFMQYQETTDQP